MLDLLKAVNTQQTTVGSKDLEFFQDDLIHFQVWVNDCILPKLSEVQRAEFTLHDLIIARKHILLLFDVSLSNIHSKGFLNILNEVIKDFGTGYRVMFTHDFIDSQLTFLIFPFYKATALSEFYK